MTTEDPNLVQLTFVLDDNAGMTAADVHEMLRGLRDALWRSDAGSVMLVSPGDAPPAGAKGDPLTVAGVAVAVTVAALPSVILLVQNWLLRQEDQHFKVKIGEVEVEVPRDAERSEILRIARVVEELEQRRRHAR